MKDHVRRADDVNRPDPQPDSRADVLSRQLESLDQAQGPLIKEDRQPGASALEAGKALGRQVVERGAAAADAVRHDERVRGTVDILGDEALGDAVGKAAEQVLGAATKLPPGATEGAMAAGRAAAVWGRAASAELSRAVQDTRSWSSPAGFQHEADDPPAAPPEKQYAVDDDPLVR